MALDFLSSIFSVVALVIVAVAALFFFIKYDVVHISRVRRGLEDLTTIVKSVRGSGGDNIEKIGKAIIKSELPAFLKDAWIGYYTSYRNWRAGGIGGAGNKAAAANATDAGNAAVAGGAGGHGGFEFYPDIRGRFTPQSVIAVPAFRRKAEAMPALVSNLGIVLFFLKLLTGLIGVDMKAATTTAGTPVYTVISDIIARLIASFPEAILILLVALAFAIFIQYADRYQYGKVINNLYSFYDVFCEKVPVADSEWLLNSLLSEQRRQTDTLYRTAPEIVSSLDGFLGKNLIPSMLWSYEESIKEHLQPVIAGLGATLEKMAAAASQSQVEGMKALSDSFLKSLNSFAGDQFKGISVSLTEVSALQIKTKDALEAFNGSFQSTLAVQKQFYATMETISDSIATYQKDISAMNSQLATTFEKTAALTEKLKEMLDQVQTGMAETEKARQDTRTQVDTYFSKMDEQVMKLTDDMHTVVENIFSRFNEIAGTTFERIETDLGRLAEGFEENSSRILESMETQSQSIGLYAKEIGGEVAELNGHLEESVKGFGEEIRSDVLNVFKEFDSGMTDISSRFSLFAQEINDSLDELTVLAESVRASKAVPRGGN